MIVRKIIPIKMVMINNEYTSKLDVKEAQEFNFDIK